MSTATTVTESLLLGEFLTSVSWEEFERRRYVYPLVTRSMPSTKPREEMGIITGLGTFDAVTEEQAAPEDKPETQWSKTFSHTEYKKKTGLTRRLLDDLDWPYMQQLASYYGSAASDTFDANTATLWNGAFSSTLAADGLSLANSAHLNKAGGNSQDNSITDVLGVEGVRVATELFDGLKDSRGNPMHAVTMDTLLVPKELREAALEIARSADRPDTTNRATNIYSGSFDVIVWNRLTTSTTAWFALNMSLLMQNSLMLVRVAPEFKTFGNPDTDIRYYGGYFRYSQGFLDWRGVVGSTGAG